MFFVSHWPAIPGAQSVHVPGAGVGGGGVGSGGVGGVGGVGGGRDAAMSSIGAEWSPPLGLKHWATLCAAGQVSAEPYRKDSSLRMNASDHPAQHKKTKQTFIHEYK